MVQGTPTVTYPIDSQLPPVARLNEPFSYEFPSSTFSSLEPMTYNLTKAPRWLSLGPNTRRLSGTPKKVDMAGRDLVEFDIELTASDGSGTTAMTSRFVISKQQAPIVELPLDQQLSNSSYFYAPSNLLFLPSTMFGFVLDGMTFSSTSGPLRYHAIMADNTPLPSWIVFDEGTMSFQGRSPDLTSLVQPPQTFELQLIASDIAGFAGSAIRFQFKIGTHLLAFRHAKLVVAASPGRNFTSPKLDLQLDGKTAGMEQLVSVTAKTPTWLDFDDLMLMLRGVPLQDVKTTNITITALDTYGNSAEATVTITIEEPIFIGHVEDVSPAVGDTVSIDLSSVISNISEIRLDVVSKPVLPWLSIDPAQMQLTGLVPDTLLESAYLVTIQATSRVSGRTESIQFDLTLQAADATDRQAITSTTNLAHATTLEESVPLSLTPLDGLDTKSILAIVIPTVVAATIFFLCLICFARRRRRHIAKKKPITKDAISAPIEGSFTTDVEYGWENDTRKVSIASRRDANGNRYERMVHENEETLRRSHTEPALCIDASETMISVEMTRAMSENNISDTNRSHRATEESTYPSFASRSITFCNPAMQVSDGELREGNEGELANPREYLVATRTSRDDWLQATQSSLADSKDVYTLRSMSTSDENIAVYPWSGSKALRSSYLSESTANRRPVSRHQSRGSWKYGVSTQSSMLESSRGHNGFGSGSELSTVDQLLSDKSFLKFADENVLEQAIMSRDTSHSSQTSRPVSRRLGNAAFFGSSMSQPGKRGKRVARTLGMDSPTVPEELLDQNVLVHYEREVTASPLHNSGNFYGLSRRSSSRLRSSLARTMTGPRKRESLRSNSSMASLDGPNDSISISAYSWSERGEFDAPGQTTQQLSRGAREPSESEWEDVTSTKGNSENSLREVFEEVSEAAPPRTRATYTGPTLSMDHHLHSSLISAAMLGHNGARIIPGMGRRPISIDSAIHGSGSLRVMIERDEDDHKAYL